MRGCSACDERLSLTERDLYTMTIAEAHALIDAAPIIRNAPQHWMDLGCGTGVFTRALAELLPIDSTITAVDVDLAVLRTLPAQHKGVHITTQLANVAHMDFPKVDGVLLANVLHFIPDPQVVLERLARSVQHVLLVEYDRTVPLPQWVPHPLPYAKTLTALAEVGFGQIVPLGRRPSRYGPDPLYALACSREAATVP